jgi:hypothetical protein
MVGLVYSTLLSLTRGLTSPSIHWSRVTDYYVRSNLAVAAP